MINQEPRVNCDSTCWCDVDLEAVGQAFNIDLYAKVEACGHSSVLSTWGPADDNEPPPPTSFPPPQPIEPNIDFSGVSTGEIEQATDRHVVADAHIFSQHLNQGTRPLLIKAESVRIVNRNHQVNLSRQGNKWISAGARLLSE